MELSYRVVDVFTDKPLAGNALCVVDAMPTDAALMQRVARETNLSETTFVQVAEDADHTYDVRIFTPVSELPFAGHPSIGTAWTLGPGTWTQRSAGATVVLEVTEHGATMSQPDPSFTEVYPEDAARGLGIPAHAAPAAFVAEVGGMRHLLVPTDHPLESLRIDAAALVPAARAVNTTGVVPFRVIDDTTIHMRAIIPSEMVTFEDPGTGSAAGPVGVLARKLYGIGADILVRQGDEIGRPSRITVHAEPGDVRVRGDVSASARGTFTFA